MSEPWSVSVAGEAPLSVATVTPLTVALVTVKPPTK